MNDRFILKYINSVHFSNISWLLAEKILRIISGLVVGIWVARYLGPAQFGLFSYAMSLVAIFKVIASLGLEGIVVKELVENKFDNNTLLGTAFYLKILGAFALFGCLAIFLYLSSTNQDVKVLVYVISAASIFHSFNVIDYELQSKMLGKLIAIPSSIVIIISSLIKIVMVSFGFPLIWFAWVVFFDSAATAFGLLAIKFVYEKNSKHYINMECFCVFSLWLAKYLLRNGWPLILIAVSTQIVTQIDRLLIYEFLGGLQVGLYSASIKFSEALNFLPSLLAAALFPSIIKAKNNTYEEYNNKLQLFFFFMTWVGLSSSLLLALLAPVLMQLYGDEYTSGVSVLMIYSINQLILFQWIAMGRWMLAENLQSRFFYYTVIGAILNTALNMVLINLYGINGAAISCVLSQAVSLYLLPLFNKESRRIVSMIMKSYIRWTPS